MRKLLLAAVVLLAACDGVPPGAAPSTPTDACGDAIPTTAHAEPGKVGLPAGWQPRAVHAGDLVIDEPGTVVRDVQVTGDVSVEAPGAVLCRVRVAGWVWNQWPNTTVGQLDQYSMRIAQSEIGSFRHPVGNKGIVGPGRYEVRRSVLMGTDGPRISQPATGGSNAVTIDQNLIVTSQCPGDDHLDGIQGYGAGTGVTITRNWIEVLGTCTPEQPLPGQISGSDATGGIFLADNEGMRAYDALIANNVIIAPNGAIRVQDGNDPDRGTWVVAQNLLVPVAGGAATKNSATNCSAPGMHWSNNHLGALAPDKPVGPGSLTDTGRVVPC